MQKTVKIKIEIEDKPTVLDMMSQYTSMYNDHIEWAFHNKSYSKQKAHVDLYDKLRQKHPDIPSAMVQCARDNAFESVKATKFKYKPVKKGYATIRYDKRTSTLRGNQLTLSCIGKRMKFILVIPDCFLDTFTKGKYVGCSLQYKNEMFFVNLVYDFEDVPKTKDTEIIGVDRGIYNIATTSDETNYSGKKIMNIRRKYLFNRKTLQKKGTRSAKRRFISMSGKEKRFIRDVNHCISKKIAAKAAGTFVLEKLEFKDKKNKGRKMNKWLSNWSFNQLEKFLEYKLWFQGKAMAFTDARYTSQKCSCCGHIYKGNRKGSRFVCVKCGYKQHSDVNASFNIRSNYIISTLAGGTGHSQLPTMLPSTLGVASHGACPRGV